MRGVDLAGVRLELESLAQKFDEWSESASRNGMHGEASAWHVAAMEVRDRLAGLAQEVARD